MKIKLDENIGVRCRKLFCEAGHDCPGVEEEGLASCPDDRIFEICREEARVLVTLDLNFANPFVFPPETAAGVAVLRPPKRIRLSHLETLVRVLLKGMCQNEITGRLWIVEPTRIRQYEPEPED